MCTALGTALVFHQYHVIQVPNPSLLNGNTRRHWELAQNNIHYLGYVSQTNTAVKASLYRCKLHPHNKLNGQAELRNFSSTHFFNKNHSFHPHLKVSINISISTAFNFGEGERKSRISLVEKLRYNMFEWNILIDQRCFKQMSLIYIKVLHQTLKNQI